MESFHDPLFSKYQDSNTLPEISTKEQTENVLKRKRSKNFICSVCQKRFYDNSHLKNHFITHTKEKGYICNICNKPFSRASSLKVHLKSHERKNIYKCSFEGCNQEYMTQQSLINHELTHTHIRSIQCSFPNCPSLFYTEEQMLTHYKTHMDYKQFSCDFPNCFDRFSSLKSKKQHIKHVHLGDDSNECMNIACVRNRERMMRISDTLQRYRSIIKKYKFMFSLLSSSLKRQLKNKYQQDISCNLDENPQVVPIQYLQTNKPYLCFSPLCGQCFSSFTKLYQHCIHNHPTETIESLIQHQIPIMKGPKYCPISNCEYGENKKVLSSLASLRRHFVKFHSDHAFC